MEIPVFGALRSQRLHIKGRALRGLQYQGGLGVEGKVSKGEKMVDRRERRGEEKRGKFRRGKEERQGFLNLQGSVP
jgi:hypothetical protein